MYKKKNNDSQEGDGWVHERPPPDPHLTVYHSAGALAAPSREPSLPRVSHYGFLARFEVPHKHLLCFDGFTSKDGNQMPAKPARGINLHLFSDYLE